MTTKDRFELLPNDAVLGIGVTGVDPNIFDVRMSNKQIGHVTVQGEVVVDATEEELVAMKDNPEFQVRVFAILFLEILTLRKQVQPAFHGE